MTELYAHAVSDRAAIFFFLLLIVQSTIYLRLAGLSASR